MGIYDRDYYRQEPRRLSMGGGRMMVTNIVLVTVIIYVADILIAAFNASRTQLMGESWLISVMALHSDALLRPWLWWQFLTYGFAHDPGSVMHVGFNMFILWMFGREVEMVIGRGEFLRLYLVMVVFSGLVWAVYEQLTTPAGELMATCIGASGAVTGMLILFALNFPRRTLLLFFVLPVPAWIVAVMVVVMDLAGFSRGQGSEVAHAAHLAGAAFALIYFRSRLNLGRLLPASLTLPGWDRISRLFRSGPRLRLHDPSEDERRLSAQVDRILEKIHQEGEASLTDEERSTLKRASRRYQRKRR